MNIDWQTTASVADLDGLAQELLDIQQGSAEDAIALLDNTLPANDRAYLEQRIIDFAHLAEDR